MKRLGHPLPGLPDGWEDQLLDEVLNRYHEARRYDLYDTPIAGYVIQGVVEEQLRRCIPPGQTPRFLVDQACGRVRRTGLPGALADQPAQRVSPAPRRRDRRTHSVSPGVRAGLGGGVSLYGDIEEEFGLFLEPTVAWDHPTADDLAHHLAEEFTKAGGEHREVCHLAVQGPSRHLVAVVGLDCRFPARQGRTRTGGC